MVSTRPSPTPARGRIAYPSAATYVPGDADNSPTYLGSEPIKKVLSSDSERDQVQGLKTWWRGFSQANDGKQQQQQQDDRSVFGEPLSQSMQYASVQISTSGPDGSLYVWGSIPVVVAKCGLYLKENATEVEGTFRISGSAKRMRDLQAIFDTGPKFGKNVDWKTLNYTTHDVATIFRRFLTQMPEPIVPFDFYDAFRDVLVEERPLEESIENYKELIRALPPINQYLLLYVLDLLSVFDRKSDKNLMTAPNLALIFQPGVISHPAHAMRPREHVLSQQVLEFLIAQQDNFLIGMELKPNKQVQNGTAVATTTGTATLAPAVSPSSEVSPESPVEPKPASIQRPPSPPKPTYTKVDADYMVPSDSDDDLPSGGFYVVEGPPKLDPPSTSLPPVSPPLTSATSGVLPSQPQSRRRSSITKPVVSRPAQSQYQAQSQAPPIIEMMEPSDSDEDVPSTGYEVRTADPAERRAALLAKQKTTVAPPQSSAVVPAPSSASSIIRRRTAPTRRNGANTARPRRGTKEAP